MKNVLFLDDDKDLCYVIEQLFYTVPGISCTSIHSVEDLKKLIPGTTFDIAILDINLGPDLPTGLDAYTYLIEKQFKGKIVFFTGHGKTHPLTQAALKFPNTMVLEKPASVESILAILE